MFAYFLICIGNHVMASTTKDFTLRVIFANFAKITETNFANITLVLYEQHDHLFIIKIMNCAPSAVACSCFKHSVVLNST